MKNIRGITAFDEGGAPAVKVFLFCGKAGSQTMHLFSSDTILAAAPEPTYSKYFVPKSRFLPIQNTSDSITREPPLGTEQQRAMQHVLCAFSRFSSKLVGLRQAPFAVQGLARRPVLKFAAGI